MKIIYGSGNKHKVEEIQNFIYNNHLDIEILSLKDIYFDEEIEENGETFEENSMIKAKAIQKFCEENQLNEIIVTDDAGLCVDALGGKPGVYSARYAGDHAPQEVVLQKLLSELKDVPEEKRTASFVCVLTAVLPNGKIIVARGETKGNIAKTPGKMGGLTYSPVFMPEEYGTVMSELEPEQLKHTHREKAWQELMPQILKELHG